MLTLTPRIFILDFDLSSENTFSDMSDSEDGFSPPLEATLRRRDSNNSWAPGSQGGSQGSTVEAKGADKDKLFLVSLGTLMTLFT